MIYIELLPGVLSVANGARSGSIRYPDHSTWTLLALILTEVYLLTRLVLNRRTLFIRLYTVGSDFFFFWKAFLFLNT